MRKSILLMIGIVICNFSFGQNAADAFKVPADRKVNSAEFQQIKDQYKNTDQQGQRSTVSFYVDYDEADALHAAEVGGDYNRFIWGLNRDFATTSTSNDDNFTVRWGAITFKDLYDYTTDISYPYDISEVTIDSVFFVFNHERAANATSDDTIKISIFQLATNASGITSSNGLVISNTILWDTLLITDQNLSPQDQLAVAGVPVGLTLPPGVKYGVLVDFFGDKENEFNLLAGFNDICSDNCAATNSIFEDNSWYYHNIAQGENAPYTTINGINSVVIPCVTQGQGPISPEDCELFYIQNWSVWTRVTLDVDFAVEAFADKPVACPGEFVQLGATVFAGEAPFSFDWSGPNIVGPNDQQTINIEPTTTSTYTLTVTDNAGDVVTSEVTVEVAGITVNLAVSGGATEINCGDVVNLLATSTGSTSGVSYTWRKNNVVQTDVTGGQFTGAGIGSYQVTATNNAGCTSSASVTITDGVNQEADFEWTTPAVATKPVSFTNLSTEKSGWNWEWNFGDGSGNTSAQENPTYTYPSQGNYVVVLTAIQDGNSDCIRERSRSVEVQTANNIADVANDGVLIELYPNPSNGEMQLNLSAFNNEDVKVSLYTLDGRKVYNNVIKNVTDYKSNLDLVNLENGIYFISIETADSQYQSRVVIMK
ncbi:MAG: T9SS C-terminal target domain-containing protein [Chitinophagaceae bacterium]|nr:MAG: T9SS C-terminal target domain-containing protein [Chitinophagaceae bacterium]